MAADVAPPSLFPGMRAAGPRPTRFRATAHDHRRLEALLGPVTLSQAAGRAAVGAVFVQTDDLSHNAIIAYECAADGSLTKAGTYDTIADALRLTITDVTLMGTDVRIAARPDPNVEGATR